MIGTTSSIITDRPSIWVPQVIEASFASIHVAQRTTGRVRVSPPSPPDALATPDAPDVPAAVSPVPVQHKGEETAALAGDLPTVMIVDDSLTVRKITSRLLAREGYQVTTAKNGVEALEQLTQALPDVMLVDIEMPRMDGFELTRNIRADKRLRKIPIIMITSRTAEKHRQYALDLGVDHYLGKPYQEDELLRLVGRHVKERRDS